MGWKGHIHKVWAVRENPNNFSSSWNRSEKWEVHNFRKSLVGSLMGYVGCKIR